MNILIVEDHYPVIEAYKMFFSLSKFGDKSNFIIANSCEDTYLKIQQALSENIVFDIAIIDYSLPTFPEQNLLNGADIILYLQKVMPNCKTMMLTAIMENLTLFEITQNIRPDAIATKSDIDGTNFLNIIETIASGKKFRSEYVIKRVEEIWQNKAFVNEQNRKILHFLSQGYLLKEIAIELAVSEITIKKRVAKIKLLLGINDNDNILREAKKRGFI